jgi:hypothetical protein
MIVFENGPHGENAPSPIEQKKLTEALLNCLQANSFYYWLNMIYNNVHHFNNNSSPTNTYGFLQDIVKIASSAKNKLIVMGTVHKDPGHTSGLILHQSNLYSQPYECFVSDSYIRFTIQLDGAYKLNVLDTNHVFHFLVSVPELLWANDTNGVIIVHNIPREMDDSTATHYYYPRVPHHFYIQRT